MDDVAPRGHLGHSAPSGVAEERRRGEGGDEGALAEEEGDGKQGNLQGESEEDMRARVRVHAYMHDA